MSVISFSLSGFQDRQTQCAPTWSPANRQAEDDLSYHRRRAEEELQIAQEMACADGRRFHYHLAALHLDRAYAGCAPQRQVA
jgi:hypothetical protein